MWRRVGFSLNLETRCRTLYHESTTIHPYIVYPTTKLMGLTGFDLVLHQGSHRGEAGEGEGGCIMFRSHSDPNLIPAPLLELREA